MEVNDILKQISSIVRSELNKPFRLFLFGSRAEGKNNEKSDIDVGIISESLIPTRKMISIQEKIEKIETLLKIDVVDFNTVDNDFKETALKNTLDF